MSSTISREQELAYRDYFEGGHSMDPSDCFDAGWKAAQARIQQLEKLAATLAAEVDAQRPVVEAAQHWYNGGTDWSAKLATAVMTYEANREKG